MSKDTLCKVAEQFYNLDPKAVKKMTEGKEKAVLAVPLQKVLGHHLHPEGCLVLGNTGWALHSPSHCSYL